MKRVNINISLTEHQIFILESFIKHFLPKRGNKRTHSGNELEYVTATIDRILKQNFGFNLTHSYVLTAFNKLGYTTFQKNGEYDSDSKKFKPSVSGDTFRGDNPHVESSAMYIYIDIDPHILRELRVATNGLPPNAGEPKRIQKQRQQELIDSFKKTVYSE